MSATSAIITIGGVDRTHYVRKGSVSIHDVLDETPNTASMTLDGRDDGVFNPAIFNPAIFNTTGFQPALNQTIQVELGSGSVLFSGSIEDVDHYYETDRRTNLAYHITCQDHTPLLNRLLIRKRYAQQSATAIITDIIANYTTGFTVVNVVAALPTVTGGIDFTEELVTRALTRVAARIGAYWYVDYAKDLHFFLTETSDAPDAILEAGPFTSKPRATRSKQNLMQLRNRVYVEGGGSAATIARAVGDVTIPVEDATWYSASGGTVVSGPQRVTYTGKTLTTLAAPSSAPSRALGTAAGELVGSYQWKVAFANAGGETAPGPATSSLSCPAFTTPGGIGGNSEVSSTIGYLIGAYGWKATFVSAVGETLGGSTATTATPAVVAGPTGTPTVAGTGVLSGTYSYKFSVLSAIGESLSSATGNVTPAALTPANAPGPSGSSSGVPAYAWVATWLDDDLRESNISPSFNSSGGANSIHNITFSAPSSPPSGVTRWRLYRTTSGGAIYKLVGETVIASGITDNNFPDTDLGQVAPAVATMKQHVDLSSITSGPTTGTLARRVYRTKAGGSQYFLVTEIPDNSTSTFTDNIPDSGLTSSAPLQNLNGKRITLTTIPTGPTGTLARRIYRTLPSGSEYKFVGQISDNSTTSFTDNTPDWSLGETMPLSNTAGASSVNLTSIPLGAAGITQRIIYRTVASGSDFKYVGTVNDNTTTTFTDTLPDSSLGRVALTSSTIAPTQVLTGIPASGTGSILYPILAGDNVNIFVVCDHAASQAVYGIREHFLQPDGRLAIPEAVARGDADKTLFGWPLQDVPYQTRDTKTRSGKTISIALDAPHITADLKIQDVTISEIDVAENLPPLYTVMASSVRFSLEDMLRKTRLDTT